MYLGDKVCVIALQGIRFVKRIDRQYHGPNGQYASHQLEIGYKGCTQVFDYEHRKELRNEMYWAIVKKLVPSVTSTTVETEEETQG